MSLIIISNPYDISSGKLTVKREIRNTPSFFQRIFLGKKQTTTKVYDTWYGTGVTWDSGYPEFAKPDANDVMLFSELWDKHVKRYKDGCHKIEDCVSMFVVY